jgi:hypothetical protein
MAQWHRAENQTSNGEVERTVSPRAVIIGWTNRSAIFRAPSPILFARRQPAGIRVSARRLVRLDSPTPTGGLTVRASRRSPNSTGRSATRNTPRRTSCGSRYPRCPRSTHLIFLTAAGKWWRLLCVSSVRVSPLFHWGHFPQARP